MEFISNVWENIWNFFQVAAVWDIVDILIITILLFLVMKFFSKTKVVSAIYAVIALVLVMALANFFKLYALSFVLESALQVGVIAIIVLFQPELRRALEQMGSARIRELFLKPQAGALEQAIMQTVDACKSLAFGRVGALIVFERRVKLADIVKTGTVVDAAVSAELLKNIFYPKAPLHDGAVIVCEGRISGASCMLPLTQNQNLSRDLGMRHRAGIGMSENSDSVVVVVSEESGAISLAIDGMLKRHLAADTLEKLLRQALMTEENKEKNGKTKPNKK